ncbi:recombinase-like helix-turn-helix domain-containing protein [Dyella caseinilytica]|uniref:Recombinase-like domain-containing protein n=1 Tax=Dyella caseinilytica TaxID=1849581 RepID=A0ABX7GSA3_9GAMM|nr:recombinase-like helix-turn-helix domain-containing protein [Dyella caseinilytica]QRN53174.1 hypothetical protein ISN74_17320 [Dyella caseinilytica]GGA12041.1 hypothetical protein GCM10011408_36870 [Dyella caseinilytica]
MTQQAFNTYLKTWQRQTPVSTPGAGSIEAVGQWENMVWQTRAREPSEYEQQLVEALEQVFGQGALELSDVVARLNALGMHDHSGHAWTESSFCSAMASLGY